MQCSSSAAAGLLGCLLTFLSFLKLSTFEKTIGYFLGMVEKC